MHDFVLPRLTADLFANMRLNERMVIVKNVYVILAFHAHELLWDLPEVLLSGLDDGNPMKNTILDENYIKKRKEEGRDIYSRSIKFAEKINAPICVEYTNELLCQIKNVLPDSFQNLREAYAGKRLYPIYGHAHHTHVSLLKNEEITQEIQWNMEYLHNLMGVPYPKYKGLFATEASYVFDKMKGVEEANINYVIFPHLSDDKVSFQFKGEGDYQYKPFLIKTEKQNILAFPRNFPISQEIWRPITKMKREEVKFQGYKLGDYPVFKNEYLYGEGEKYPISFEEGVEIYKEVLCRELNNAPEDGVLVYLQDLELMDFGDIALDIMEKAWEEVLEEAKETLRVHFVTPDEYIDEVMKPGRLDNLPELFFDSINWAPEIRLILRVDGHYPPLGVFGAGRYEKEKTGLYDHPHIFWENGKYHCGIFDTLVENFNLAVNIPADGKHFDQTGYELTREDSDIQAIMYLRLMKRACNWGWRPTEGRQKIPCLKGYLICSVLLKKLEDSFADLICSRFLKRLDERNLVGIVRTLDVFIDNRIKYLRYGMERFREEGCDLSSADKEIENAFKWKKEALQKAAELYTVNKSPAVDYFTLKRMLQLMRDYCQAVFMATDHIQKIWGAVPDQEYLVDKMYEFLYELYPPIFPAMIREIDSMGKGEIEEYFNTLREAVYV